MGYSPAAIGLSYVPQTIAFWWAGTAAARRCKMGRPADAAVAAGALCTERHRHWAVGFIPGAGLAEILIPFCVMAIANGAIYLSLWRRRCVRSRRRQAARLRCRTPCSWGCASGKPVVSALIATPLLTTTSVMLATVALAVIGYRMQASAQDESTQVETSHA